jgi:hypothetical protein
MRREGGASPDVGGDLGAQSTDATSTRGIVAGITGDGTNWTAGRGHAGPTGRGSRGSEARTAAAVFGGDTASAGGRADVPTSVRPGAIGETPPAAALRGDDARIPRRRAAPVRGEAAQASGPRLRATGAGAAFVSFHLSLHAQLPQPTAANGDVARRLGAAADALGSNVASTRAALRARRATLLLWLTAGRARTARRSCGR